MNKHWAKALAAGAGFAIVAPAHAINFDWLGGEFAWNTKLTAGAQIRTEGVDYGRMGKLNVPGQQYLCSNRGGDTSLGPYDDDCISLFGSPAPNQRLVDAKGSYFGALLDDADQNFKAGDFTSGVFKINTQLTGSWEDLTIKLNYVGFYDSILYNLDRTHNNTQYQPRHERQSSSVQGRAGLKGEFREAFAQYSFSIGERTFSISAGNQRVRWGEANLHLFNTLDAINPLDAILALQPGFNLNELAVPTGMVLISGDIIPNLSAETFYQYDWDATRVQPSGTLQSSVDPAGIAAYRPVLSLGQFPEDPNDQFIPGLPFRLLSSSTRNAPVYENGTPPKDGGQYGIRINYYAENLNGGTEFGFYFANLHSRLPYFSISEAQATCLRQGNNQVTALAACAPFNPYVLGNAFPSKDPLPINSSTLLLDYPENIKMFGVSFNTTLLGWSVSGEYSYRPNQPAQVLISDVFYAGYQQAFSTFDIALTQQGIGQALAQNGVNLQQLLQILGPEGAAVLAQLPLIDTGVGPILPSASTFIPSYLATYRGRCLPTQPGCRSDTANEYQPGEYVKGYERLKTGQFVINALKLFPSHFGADDITFLAEFGFENIFDMPKKGDLYMQGTIEHTHPSPGADCSGFPDGTNCASPTVTARVNPTQQKHGFADDFSCGVRFLIQANYSNFLNSGINVKPTLLVFRDLYGIAPFPAQNYVEGNLWMIPGFQFEIGQSLNGTLLYQIYDGRDQPLQDRDNVSFSLTYSF